MKRERERSTPAPLHPDASPPSVGTARRHTHSASLSAGRTDTPCPICGALVSDDRFGAHASEVHGYIGAADEDARTRNADRSTAMRRAFEYFGELLARPWLDGTCNACDGPPVRAVYLFARVLDRPRVLVCLPCAARGMGHIPYLGVTSLTREDRQDLKASGKRARQRTSADGGGGVWFVGSGRTRRPGSHRC